MGPKTISPIEDGGNGVGDPEGMRAPMEPKGIGPREEERTVKKLIDPRKPSAEEVEDHYRTHLAYRNWCPHCIRGKGKDMDHRKGADEERGLGEYSFDYAFPGDEMGFKLTILVGKERNTGMLMATTVPMKGTTGRFSADKVVEFIAECGDAGGDIIIKTDQEASIKALVRDIVDIGKRTIVEEAPKGSKGSNGIVERGVQTMEGQLRVLKSAFEERVGRRVDAEARVVTFMAEYGAYLVNRLEVGRDGKTAYERSKGKLGRVLGVEFGEKLMYKVKPKDKMEKINPRWEYGVFVGVRRESGEVWVATKEGMEKARSVRRIPVADRWGPDCVNWVKNVPWNRGKGNGEPDGDIPEEKLVEASGDRGGGENGPGVIIIKTRETAPREFQIRKSDAEKHGYTRGCGGCSSWFRGLARQPHSEACRRRFKELTAGGAKVKMAEAKKAEFEEKAKTILRRRPRSTRRKSGRQPRWKRTWKRSS